MLNNGDKCIDLKEKIKAIFKRNKGRYGYRRITVTLRLAGITVNHKKVKRLMDELGIKSLIRKKKYQSFKGEFGLQAKNLLNRNFDAQQPNQKWVTDVTEFNVSGEKLYLSPILDLYNGEIIAFETARRPLFNMVQTMLNKAYVKLKKHDKPILHSDQGWQYRMPVYQQSLKQYSVTQSMSRRGNCLDNATMESFFGTLKSEFFYLEKFRNIDELEAGIKEYIHYYNNARIKLKLNGLSPVQYRKEMGLIK